ncbi:MAG: SIS domain-containing protein [Woeseiaceae bacterium]
MVALYDRIMEGLRERNRVSRVFFDAEGTRLAQACRDMAARFSRGGKLLACGLRHTATDAQHVAVEFVHPVIVGKRALPAWDVSARYCPSVLALTGPDDIVMAFDPSGDDPRLARLLTAVHARGAQTFALAGRNADYGIRVVHPDPFIHQEIVEILYHVLWETVHVFLEHGATPHDAGPAAFLYPFLATVEQATDGLIDEVTTSIRSKARDDERLRDEVAERQCPAIVGAVTTIRERIQLGGKLLMLGNGGSATDATDWALDCVDSPKGYPSVPAISLAANPSVVSALANDVGVDAVFVRQIIAHAQPADVLVAITTSGVSTNVIAALVEGRRRGLLTIALAGYDGGEIARQNLADFSVVVPSDYIPRIQEVHASVYHVMTDLIAGQPAT